jgi:hypothetical protein
MGEEEVTRLERSVVPHRYIPNGFIDSDQLMCLIASPATDRREVNGM